MNTTALTRTRVREPLFMNDMPIPEIKTTSFQVDRFQYQSPNGNIEGIRCVPLQSNGRTVLFFRGGSRNFGRLVMAHGSLLFLAERGFTVYATQYSGGPNSEGKDEYGGSDVADVHALLDVARADGAYKDGDFLGALGFSRGAMEACIAMKQGLPITTAVFIGGVYDFRNVAVERPDILAMWKRDEMFDVNEQSIADRSAITFVNALPNIPFLLLHSEQDDRVPSQQAHNMASVLGERATLQMFPGNDHGLVQIIEERNRLTTEWFSR